jgi:hypothetical protein
MDSRRIDMNNKLSINDYIAENKILDANPNYSNRYKRDVFKTIIAKIRPFDALTFANDSGWGYIIDRNEDGYMENKSIERRSKRFLKIYEYDYGAFSIDNICKYGQKRYY